MAEGRSLARMVAESLLRRKAWFCPWRRRPEEAGGAVAKAALRKKACSGQPEKASKK